MGVAVAVGAIAAVISTTGTVVGGNGAVPVELSSKAALQNDTFVAPVCPGDTGRKLKGFVELDIRALPAASLPRDKQQMELIFRDIYNNISGMCRDPYSRILHNATLVGWESLAVDKGQPSITKTVWTGIVSCDGCLGE